MFALNDEVLVHRSFAKDACDGRVVFVIGFGEIVVHYKGKGGDEHLRIFRKNGSHFDGDENFRITLKPEPVEYRWRRVCIDGETNCSATNPLLLHYSDAGWLRCRIEVCDDGLHYTDFVFIPRDDDPRKETENGNKS